MMDPSCRMVGVTVTPFLRDCTPDLEEIFRQTQRMTAAQADAILPCASTGDFVKMSFADRIRVLETVAEANEGKKFLLAGACEASASGAVQAIQAAKRLNYTGCIVCPPYYYPQDQQAVLAFYRQVCQGAEGMPVIAYHVPAFTTGIEISTFRKLLEIPNLVGIKDSSANMKRIAHLCDIAAQERPGFMVYTGTDDCLLPALCAGCAGSMTALAASMPQSIRGIYDAFDKGDLKTAMERQRAILPIIRLADDFAFPLGYKLLAKAAGWRIEEDFSAAELAQYEQMRAALQALQA